jgi:hypothetical protein
MNKLKLILGIIIICLISQSCKKKIRIYYSLNVFTQKINTENTLNYPDEFKKLLLPMNIDIDKKTSLIISSVSKEQAVTIKRIDSDYEFPLSINTDSKFKSMSSSKGAENRLGKAFKNLEIPNELKENNGVLNYSKLEKYNNIFIYSNKYEGDSIIILNSKYKVYNSIDELKYSLASSIMKKFKEKKNIGEYAILYNIDFNLDTISGVSIYTKMPEKIAKVEETNINNRTSGDKYAIKEPKTLPTVNCNTQLSASSVEDWLYKLTSTSFDDCRKDNLASNYSEFFESNAKVVLVDNIGNPMQTFSSVSSYVSRIRGKNRKIKVDDENSIVNGGRYTKLAVREP